MLGHRTSLNTFRMTEIISSMFSDLNGRKLETIIKTENLKICEKKQHAPEQPMSQKIKGIF